MMTDDARQPFVAAHEAPDHVPPHIRAWMETEDGFRQVTQIALDALGDTTNVVTSAEVRELIEEAYRRREDQP